jgi:hypothetical protein
MAQIDDAYWYLAGADVAVADQADTEACATQCLNTEDCMFMTFDFAAAAGAGCSIRKASGTG